MLCVRAVEGMFLNYMQNVWLQSNFAGLDGGAMHMESVATAPPGSDLVNITMIDNHAKSFGGAVNEAGSNVTIRESVVANNIADLYGGGLFSFFAGLYLIDTNITGNS